MQLFFAPQKKGFTVHTERAQAIARGHEVLGAAGLNKHLPVVTTARSRARETGSIKRSCNS